MKKLLFALLFFITCGEPRPFEPYATYRYEIQADQRENAARFLEKCNKDAMESLNSFSLKAQCLTQTETIFGVQKCFMVMENGLLISCEEHNKRK